MGKTWTQAAVDYLADLEICPRCDGGPIDEGVCTACRVDLRGVRGTALWRASQEAAALLAQRQMQVDALPVVVAAAAAPVGAPVAAPVGEYAPPRVYAPPAPSWVTPPPVAAPAGASSQISVQSVLAVAGAALFAVAAIVFTFFNPDLTNFATRSLILAGVTAVFLGGAWALARAHLQFSAEAVGALGMVFVVLDISSLARAVPLGISGWTAVGLATLLCSGAMVLLAALARIRSWLWAGLVGVALAPAFLGYAGESFVSAMVGHLALGFVACGLHRVIEPLRDRFDSPLAADRGTANLLQLLAAAVVTLQLALGATTSDVNVVEGASVLAALAVLAALSAATAARGFWSYLAGAYAVSAVAILPGVLEGQRPELWLLAVAVAGAVAFTGLTAVVPPRPVARNQSILGGWTALLLIALPALVVLPLHTFGIGGSAVPTMLSLLAVATGTWLATITARSGSTDAATVRMRAVALWLLVVVTLAFANWAQFLPLTRVAIGLALAVGIAALATRIPPVRTAPRALRSVLVTAAHLHLVFAAAMFRAEPGLQLVVGAAAVLALVVVARTLPAGLRSLHVGVGFAYSLLVIASALGDAGVETIAVLCVTASIGAATALAATLIRQVQPRPWYAILIVTTVPFLIGIASVLVVRSGWTALSTAVTFALALTLVQTRRPGLNSQVRSAAAALLVPTLAVVVVCLGAQVLLDSASPVTLPVIAGIVAVVLPFTLVIERALVRHGIGPAEARAVRDWIELSSVVTSALAVLLALLRAAAGFETSFLVLVILGLGAAAAGVLTRRRAAWTLAAIAWTGALWSLWAMLAITAIEPYLLPPALAATVLGAVFVIRGLPGRAFYSIGLAIFVATPVLVVVASGDGSAGNERWRTHALLALAAVLGGIAGLALARRAVPLVLPSALAAVLAASAGAVQGVRMGLNLDGSGTQEALVLLPVLGYAVVAALLAALAAAVLVRFAGGMHGGLAASIVRRRWAYAPALLFLAAGPITAVRAGPVSLWLMWSFAVVLLGAMILIVLRALTRAVTAPPIWFVFALAWCVAVAGWSSRELRVEAYSLPLGLALLAAGALAARAELGKPSITSWPVGHRGSWRLLTPGLVATFLPSLLSTGTDPQTWRAIMVIALALAAILIGSLRRLGAPFVIGIVVLPIENVIVFAVQLGRSISAAPWWITLATAGAVLLVIAVTSERRTRGGTAARLRDLN